MNVMFLPAAAGVQGVQQVPAAAAGVAGMQQPVVPMQMPLQMPMQMAAAGGAAGQQGMQQMLLPQMAGMPQMQYMMPTQGVGGMGGMVQPMMIVPMMMQPDASGDANKSNVKDVTDADEAPQGEDNANAQRSGPPGDGGRHWSPVLRASAQTPFEGLAGAIAKRARQYPTVVVEGMGADSVGKIMRGLVLAASFMVDDHIIFSARCKFVMCKSRPSLSFELVREKATTAGLPKASKVIVVHSNNVVGKVAGAMAKIVRCPSGALRETRLRCGPLPDALNVAAKAVALARTMLGEVGCDMKIIPVIPERALPPDLDELVFELIPFPTSAWAREAETEE